jgi:hypothetical protein
MTVLPAASAYRTQAKVQNDAGWEAQLAKLKQYKAEHGDCNVPYSWADDRELGSWVSVQRVGKKNLDRGLEPSKGMTVARAAKLEALGFAWQASDKRAAWRARQKKPKATDRPSPNHFRP